MGQAFGRQSDVCRNAVRVEERRDDDSIDSIRERLADYDFKTRPVIARLEGLDLLIRVNADQSDELVRDEIARQMREILAGAGMGPRR